MLIAIDGNEANVKNRVGSNVYAYKILCHIYNNNNNNLPARNAFSIADAGGEFKIYLKQEPLSDLPRETDWWQYKVLKPRFLWTQWRLPLELYLTKNRPDVFFTPGHYAPRFCPVPFVISIMDLAFLRYPDQFKKNDLYQLVNWTKYSVSKAQHIFTISEFTKKEIVNFYHYPEERITVTYPGINEFRIQNSEFRIIFERLKTKYGLIKEKYLLYIGTLQPRKNLVKLIEAFKKLFIHYPCLAGRQALPITHLVICGKKGWLYDDIFTKVKELGLENKVIFTGFISEEEKYVLLKNALAFILPSLYEGFGIPVLEALQVGCSAIVSKNSSLTEVVGDIATYIDDPNSIDSIYQAMLKMVKLDSNKRKELIEKGLKQVKKFSWQKAARQTLAVLNRIGGENVLF